MMEQQKETQDVSLKDGQEVSFLKRPKTNPDRPWELSAEDQGFFDRKFKALEYFKNKLNGSKEQSSKSSQEAVTSLTRRIDALDTRANPKEIEAIMERLNDLEKQKQGIIKSGESQVQNIADAEYVDFEEVETKDELKVQKQPDTTEKSKPEESTKEEIKEKTKEEEKIPEKAEEKPLEPGDEVYKDGVFYKIHDFLPEYEEGWRRHKHPGTVEQGAFKHFDEKEHRWVITEEKRVGDKAEKQKEMDNKPHRQFRAVIPGGGGFSYFSEDQVTRVTPELKEKIKKMKKESGRGINFGTGEDFSNI